MPWRNGGGFTHEAIREPPDGPSFRWRVSLAQIDSSGPFSDFSGYDRFMVLLQGTGIRLTFAGGRVVTLTDPGDLVEFDGAVSTHCELRAGPCMDLNLMVAQTLHAGTAWVQRLEEPYRAPGVGHAVTLVFAIDGGIAVGLGEGVPTRLDAWDLAVLESGEVPVVLPLAAGGSAPRLVFFATLDDNPR